LTAAEAYREPDALKRDSKVASTELVTQRKVSGAPLVDGAIRNWPNLQTCTQTSVSAVLRPAETATPAHSHAHKSVRVCHSAVLEVTLRMLALTK
jgi:hypothetical protein